MCLKPKPLPPIPQDTRQVAQRIYPPEHLLRRLGEEYADVLRDEDFADLYPPTGQPALSPWLLALVTVLQAVEHCSDRLAAEMVRSRIDWKYALHLPLDYPGFDPSVLCEFRQRLVSHQAQRRVFDAFLRRLKDKGFLNGRALQRTDSLAVVAAVRELTKIELVRETLRLALEAIAKENPQWLQTHTPADWLQTYGAWTQGERLVRESGPRAGGEIKRLLVRTGQDGFTLLHALEAPEATALRPLPAVDVLRTVWSQHFRRDPLKTSLTPLDTTEDMPAAQTVQEGVQMLPTSSVDDGQRGNIVVTPHDPQARRATKGAQAWIGYKLHLSETAAQDAPLLITDLEVGAAAAYDCHCLDPIQERLQARNLLPDTHLADAGYVNGPTMHRSRERQVELLGPVPADTFGASRQERFFPAEAFQVDVANQQATCPGGHPSQRWSVYHRRGGEDKDLMAILWDKQVCGRCPQRERCLPPGQPHRLLRLSRHYDLLSARRREQKSAAFQARYRRRAGIEATFSHLVNVRRARRTPYRGAQKTLGYYAALCVGLNLCRAVAWQAGKRPKRERESRLCRLLAERSVEGAPGAAP